MPKKRKKLYLVSVAPVVSLPLSRDPFFTYSSDIDIPKGSLVRIPLASRTVDGIVLESKPLVHKPAFRVRPITAIIEPSFVGDKTIDLVRYISEIYFSPFGISIKHALPKRVKERKKQIEEKPLTPLPARTPSEKKLLTTIKKHPSAYLNPATPTEKNTIFLTLAQHTLEKKEQILFLVPDIILVSELALFFERFFPIQSIATIESKLGNGAYYSNWERIRSGEASIVIGTRQALFAPFRKLRSIIFDFDSAEGYKQWDMTPRYDGKTGAQKLAELWKAHLLLVSPIQTIETLLEEERGSIQKVDGGASKRKTNLILSDLKLERYKKNFSPFSTLVVEWLGETLRRGKQALLIINRQGTSIFSICERCRETFRCPKCDRALVGSKDETYRCLHCSYRTDDFPKCGKCGGLAFRNVGFGTEKIEREVKKLFPRAHTARIDGPSLRAEKNFRSFTKKITSGAIDILIGTEAALYGPRLPKPALIAILDADNTLKFPDYRAEERLLRSVCTAKWLASEESGTVILQTFHSEERHFRILSEGKEEEWEQAILKEREAFHYPPDGVLVKLEYRETNLELLEKETGKAMNILRPSEEKEVIRYIVSDPITPFVSKVRGKNIQTIILRIPGNTLPESLIEKIILLSKRGWIVDRNPLSLT